MQHCDTLIAARWCAPVEPADAVLEDHAIAVVDGRVTEILPAAEARTRYQPSQSFERPHHIAIPGFVNAHTHAAMTLFRGFADDLPLERWLADGIWPAERRWVSAEFVRDGTALAIAEMLSGGTTCFSDQYFFPDIVAKTAIDMQMRANVGTPVVDFPTAWANDADEYLGKATDLVHDAFVDHPLITTCFAPHSTASLSDKSFTALRVLADQLDLRVQIHLHETAAEVQQAVQTTGRRPFARLESLGLVNASLLAVHAVHVTAEEIRAMSEAGVAVAHCPRSNLKLASGIAPLTALREASLTVGIGTDGAASNNRLDMLDELRTAALLAKAGSGDAAAMPAHAALAAATLDSARALGLGDNIGSLLPGKWADVACFDLNALNSQPLSDPVSQLVYTAQASQASDVWVAGRHLLEGGRLTHIPVADIVARCGEWRAKLSGHQRQTP